MDFLCLRFLCEGCARRFAPVRVCTLLSTLIIIIVVQTLGQCGSTLGQSWGLVFGFPYLFSFVLLTYAQSSWSFWKHWRTHYLSEPRFTVIVKAVSYRFRICIFCIEPSYFLTDQSRFAKEGYLWPNLSHFFTSSLFCCSYEYHKIQNIVKWFKSYWYILHTCNFSTSRIHKWGHLFIAYNEAYHSTHFQIFQQAPEVIHILSIL